MTEKKLVVNGLLVTYGEAGTVGPAILLIHGWGDSANTFSNLVAILESEYRIFAINLPGFGGSDSPKTAWGLQDFANTVEQFTKKLNLDLYCVIGHSNGGAVAIKALSSTGLKSERLVLLASSGIRDVYKSRKKALRLVAKAAKVATYPLPKKAKDKLKKRAYSAIGSDMFAAEHLQETFKNIVTEDVRQDADKLRLPSLLIYGSEDTSTPPEFGKQFAGLITGAWLEIIDGAGHFVHHDSSHRVNVLVEKFLS